jgi:ABC-type dipeptide/oligopeptide/nickel transport system permease subunit
LGIAAIDDVLLWFSSPIIALPLTLILVVVVLAFVFGGKTLTEKLLSGVKSAAEGTIANVTRSAASSLLKKE